MREYLFQGKRVDNGEWVEGGIIPLDTDSGYVFIAEPFLSASTLPVHEIVKHHMHLVYPESVGQYTGMNEFVVSDRSFNKPLFEGDIVEVWSKRRIPTSYYYSPSSSQYDVEVKARAVICFKYGKWFLDYDNGYNKSLCELRGNEQMERTVDSWSELDHYRYNGDEEWYREHNSRCKHHDIVKLGNVFENADLLEG